MKLELKRQAFLEAWQIAERFVDTKAAKDSIGGIFITASDDGKVILEATDLKTSVRCNAEGVNVVEPGVAVVPS
ncbi:MAG: DNA polymerase III subunit beta, partial [Synergistaceae bacterium]|nr:DNA polymerase III subunit beta [Synergistaceae bacterium]